MCGLVGMAGDFLFKHRNMMKNLIFFNTLRGKDSTGVAYLDSKKNTVELKKLTCPGYDFINMPWIDNLLGLNHGVWLGHGRFKTVGDVSRLNAHPFFVHDDEERIAMFGAHNGTLDGKYEIEKELGEQFGTDSEALLNLIYKVGPKKAIAMVRGAWALTWWDSDSNSVNFLRNKERPLYYSFTEDMKHLVWASEMWMIRVAAAKEGVNLIQNDKKGEVVYSVPEDTLLSFPLPSFEKNDTEFDFPKRKGGLLGAPEKKNFWVPAKGQYNRPQIRYPADDYNDDIEAWLLGVGKTEKENDKETKTLGKKEEKKRENSTSDGRSPSKDEVVGFEGQMVDRQLYLEMCKAGCDWCGESIAPEHGAAWLDECNLCCHNCLRGTHFSVNLKEQKIIERVKNIVRS